MITRYTSNGTPIHFPDETPETVIRATLQRAERGELVRPAPASAPSSGQSFDLSALRPGARPAPSTPSVDPRAATEARLRAALPPPPPADPRPLDERSSRSPEWWQSVTGSPDDKSVAIARDRQLRAAEEQGAAAMRDLGFTDEGMYYLNPGTGERVLKRRRTGYSAPELDSEYRPRDAVDRLSDVYEMEGRGVPDLERREREREVGRAAVGGIPGRVAASEAGTLLPLQAAEAVGSGIRQEISDLAAGRLPQRTGESFARGVRHGWADSPITQGAERLNRDIVEPDRDWLARAATAAGLSPAASATIDTAQTVAGEALNPGNWVGLDLLRAGSMASRRGANVLDRAAALESRGGARTIDTGEGITVREYGAGSDPDHIDLLRRLRREQIAEARREPLIYHDPHETIGGWKGVIPDAVRRGLREIPPEIRHKLPDPVHRAVNRNRDWRVHKAGYNMGYPFGRAPLAVPEPDGPRPLPRDMARETVPVEISGGSPESRESVLRAWDYASRRHPRLAAGVRRIVVHDTPGVGAVDRDGTLHLGPGDDLGPIMHEMTHVAQLARGGFEKPYTRSLIAGQESTAIRRGEVYSRIPVPNRPSRVENPKLHLVDKRDLGGGMTSSVFDVDGEPLRRETIRVKQRGGRPVEVNIDYRYNPEATAFDPPYVSGIVGAETVPDDIAERIAVEVRARGVEQFDVGALRAGTGRNTLLVSDGATGSAAGAAGPGSDISDRFAAYLRDNGLDDPDAYYDLPPTARADLDRGFAATDNGPVSESWLDYLDAQRLEPRDYRALPLPERARLESDYRMWAAERAEPDIAPDPAEMTAGERADLTRRGHPEFAEATRPGNQLADRLLPSLLDEFPGADPRLLADTHRRAVEAELAAGRWPRGLVGDDYPDIVERYGFRSVPDHTQPGGMLNPLPVGDLPDGLVEGGSLGQQVYDDPMEAVLGPATASEYRRLDDALRNPSRDLFPHEEDEIFRRLDEIEGSVTPEQWRFAVSGQGAVPPLPEGRVFAMEPGPGHGHVDTAIPQPGNLAGQSRIVPDGSGGVRALPPDLGPVPANDLNRPGPRRMLMREPPPHVPLPEERVAEAMGWKRPMGPPQSTRAVSAGAPDPAFRGSIDPIVTPHGQTNIAAQLDPAAGYFGDPEVAGYVIEESERVFRAQGPPQSWDTLEEMALRNGRTKESFLADASHWSVLPPEERLRLLYVVKGKEAEISKLQAKLARGEASDIEKAELLRQIESRADLIRLGVKTGSAYGRALNSLKIEARLALDDNQLLRQQLYRKYQTQLDAEKGLMDALARLDPSNPDELQAFLRAVDRPKFREYVQEYWVASILSGPATHERNLIGNTVNMVMENAVIRPTAALWDAAAVARTGSREVFLRETPAAIVGLTRGVREGLRRGLRVLKTGYDPDTMKGKLFPVRSAFARSQNRVVREVVGPVVTMPLRLLAASDAVFKSMNFTAELYAQAARIASKEGLDGAAFAARTAELVSNPTTSMLDAADSYALKATFNDEASAIGKAVINLRESVPVVGGFILPFVKIADRLMVRGFEYTPVGAAKAIGAARAGLNAEAADLAARSSIGSLILAYAASLAMEGRLTAGAPTDEGEKAAFYGANKQAWAVRTEDGTWIPYGGLQPVGTPFAIAAAAWKGWAEHGEDPDVEKLGHAAAEIGVYVTDQSYMDALSKFMDAVSGSERERGRAFSDLATNTVWGFAPYSGMTRTVARAIDPRVIDAQTMSDRLWQNVPGISLGMDARLTPWGEDVIPQGGRLRGILAPGSIVLPSREKTDPLDVELQRLGIPLGYVGKTISDKLGQDNRGPWKLSPEEWHFYQQTAGRATRKALESLFAKPSYQSMTDTERQRDEVEKAIGKAREYAKIQTVRKHRGLGWH